MRRLLLALLLFAGPAWADSGMMMAGVANRQMPLDPLSTPTDCYSIRRLRTAYTANKAFNVIRASDSTTTDIGFRADGSPDTATLATFLNATTGKFVTFYDQCGARNLTQATDANRPAVTQSALGIYPAPTYTSGTITLAASSLTPATGLMSYAVVANRSSGTGNCAFLRPTGNSSNNIFGGSSAGFWRVTAGGATRTGAAADVAWHSGQAVANGASSVIVVDGTATSGTTTANTTAGVTDVVGIASTTCLVPEVAFWDNVGLTAAQYGFINSNQHIGFRF